MNRGDIDQFDDAISSAVYHDDASRPFRNCAWRQQEPEPPIFYPLFYGQSLYLSRKYFHRKRSRAALPRDMKDRVMGPEPVEVVLHDRHGQLAFVRAAAGVNRHGRP